MKKEVRAILTNDAVYGLLFSVFDTENNRVSIWQSNGNTNTEDAVKEYLEEIEGYMCHSIKKMRQTHYNVIEISWEDHISYMVFTPLLEESGVNTHKEINH